MEIDPTATSKAKSKKKEKAPQGYPARAYHPTPTKTDTSTQGVSTPRTPEKCTEVVGKKAARAANKAALTRPPSHIPPPSQLLSQLQGD